MAQPIENVTTELYEQLEEAFESDSKRSKSEGEAYGVSLREAVPLELHAVWDAPENRPDPVDLLRSQEEDRVKELLPLRHERMSVSPFTFYRGAALIMASDLSGLPVTGVFVQACGDAHVANFGLFSSPERHMVFDINDFDETLPGPWEWDVKRLVASIEICGRDNDFSIKERKHAVKACARSYREGMRSFANMGHLDVWFSHLDVELLASELSANASPLNQGATSKLLEKAKSKDNSRALQKLTEVVDGKLRIISNPPLIVPLREIARQIVAEQAGEAMASGLTSSFDDELLEMETGTLLSNYVRTLTPDKRHLIDSYTAVDMARKVVGVGSVGTRAWIVVMSGIDESDALVLQVKEAKRSVLERFVGQSAAKQNGQRVVEGQRAMQTVSDMLLGWCRVPDAEGVDKDYYVRQLWDGKGSIPLLSLDPKQLTLLAEACGWTLAHAHARTGDRFAIASYLGETDAFDKAMEKFAYAYADQNEADYQRFMQALKEGELA